MSTEKKRMEAALARSAMYRALRVKLEELGYVEVETPALVPTPGMEPQITAFAVPFVPETPGYAESTLYLHSSPEYAMKRLLAMGMQRIFQICKVFRNGEVAVQHNPEFTMLELYRSPGDYRVIMQDLEALCDAAARAVGAAPLKPSFERLTVREALLGRTGIDLNGCLDAEAFRRQAESRGFRFAPGKRSFEDLYFQVFLEKVEATLGVERPTFLVDYPASMASLSKLKADDPRYAERFELYIRGTELANGFSELNDAAEQRRRLVKEQEERRLAGRPVYALDERFLDAVGRMPNAGGVALGLDRLLMVLLGVEKISDVLLFPAAEFLG